MVRMYKRKVSENSKDFKLEVVKKIDRQEISLSEPPKHFGSTK